VYANKSWNGTERNGTTGNCTVIGGGAVGVSRSAIFSLIVLFDENIKEKRPNTLGDEE
jgi:hypothetical protein